MRGYVVVVPGTEVQLVEASRPQHAIGKAKRKRGETIVVERATVFPLTSMYEDKPRPPKVSANQLSLLG